MLSGKLLPIRPRPQAEELLSSWVLRLARANRLSLNAFIALLFQDRFLWTRDIDKLAPEGVLVALSERTAIPVERILQTTLQGYEGALYRKHNPYGNTRWILPLGKVNWARYGYGMQCCPACLAEDKEPYLRQGWRLSWYTVCPRHGLPLIDACPTCGRPLAFGRGDLGGRRHTVNTEPVHLCDNCKADFSGAGAAERTVRDLVAEVGEFTVWLEDGLRERRFFFGGSTVPSVEFFDVLATVLNRLVTVKKERRFLEAAKEASGIHVEVSLGARVGIGFERVRLDQRLRLLGIAAWLFGKWPERFLGVLRQTDWAPSAFRIEMEEPPGWFRKVLEQK